MKVHTQVVLVWLNLKVDKLFLCIFIATVENLPIQPWFSWESQQRKTWNVTRRHPGYGLCWLNSYTIPNNCSVEVQRAENLKMLRRDYQNFMSDLLMKGYAVKISNVWRWEGLVYTLLWGLPPRKEKIVCSWPYGHNVKHRGCVSSSKSATRGQQSFAISPVARRKLEWTSARIQDGRALWCTTSALKKTSEDARNKMTQWGRVHTGSYF